MRNLKRIGYFYYVDWSFDELVLVMLVILCILVILSANCQDAFHLDFFDVFSKTFDFLSIFEKFDNKQYKLWPKKDH